ncbi:MAG: hypothetical protein ACK5Y2_13595 [Bdellovibrionales bacterium]
MVTDNQISNTGVATHNFFSPTLISWRATLAGLSITLFTFFAFLALMMGLGGLGLSDGASAQNAGVFAASGLFIAIVLSIFGGSYFASRVAKVTSEGMGVSQGLLVGAVFVLFILFQVMSAVGTLGKAAGDALGIVGSSAQNAAQNPMVQDIVSDAVGDLNLRSDPSRVMSGVSSRLLRGDQEGAKNYLAREAGISPTEADQRIAGAQTQINQGLEQARTASATALQATGWSLFILILLSAVASALGGFFAAKRNYSHTLDISSRQARQTPTPTFIPTHT